MMPLHVDCAIVPGGQHRHEHETSIRMAPQPPPKQNPDRRSEATARLVAGSGAATSRYLVLPTGFRALSSSRLPAGKHEARSSNASQLLRAFQPTATGCIPDTDDWKGEVPAES